MSLAGDLVPYISDPTVSLVLVRVAGARWSPASDDPHWESGPLQLRTVELFAGQAPKPGETISVAARRYADPMKRGEMGFDAWNTLTLDVGATIVFALRRVNEAWIPLAGEDVPPGDQRMAAALRRAVEIEKLDAPARRGVAFAQALGSQDALLFRYALDAITRRGRVPREQAADIMAQRMAANGLSANARFQLVQQAAKRPIYDDDRGADVANRLAIGVIAQALVRETTPEWSLIWAQLLSTSLLPAFSTDAKQDTEIRRALIRAVAEPVRRDVPAALTKAAAQSPNDPRIARLADEWRAAVR